MSVRSFSGDPTTSLRQRFAAWRLERAELRLEDAEYHLHKWRFANTPSEDRREEKRIKRLKAKVVRLGGEVEDDDDD